MIFTHPKLFALSVIIAAYLIIYLFAHRYHTHKTTYAALWKRVGQRRGTRRDTLRRAATVLVSLVMLGWLVGLAAGPELRADRRSPTDLVIMVDTSPSMLRQNRERLTAFAQVGVRVAAFLAEAELEAEDRVWVLVLRRGTAVAVGPFAGGKDAEVLHVVQGLEADFEPLGDEERQGRLRSELERIGKTASPSPHRRKVLMVMTDHDRTLLDEAWPEGWETFGEGVGAQTLDAAMLSATPLASNRVWVTARGGSGMTAHYASGRDAGERMRPHPAGGMVVDLDLPQDEPFVELRLESTESDGITENNQLRLYGERTEPLSIAVIGDSSAASERVYRLMLEVAPRSATVERPSHEARDADVVVVGTRGAGIPKPLRAGVLIALGVLPPELGVTQAIGEGGTTSGQLIAPAWLTGEESRFWLDEVRFEAVAPLAANQAGWESLFVDTRWGTLVAARRMEGLDVLYVAADAEWTTLLEQPAFALMLRRWLAHLTRRPASSEAPAWIAGQPIRFRARGPVEVELRSRLLHAPRRWLVQPDDSSPEVVFAHTHCPGEYTVKRARGNETVYETYDLQWLADAREIPFEAQPARPLAGSPFSGRAEALPWWRSQWWLMLGLAGCFLLLMEWGLYFSGLTD